MAFGLGRRRSLLTKFYVALLIAVLPLLLLQQWYVLPAIRQQLREDRIRSVRQLVERGHGILEAYEARVRAGELTPREAQLEAAAMLEGPRYAKAEYYWINDLETRLVMHPFLPGRIGEDMKGYQDVAGKRVFSTWSAPGPTSPLPPEVGQGEGLGDPGLDSGVFSNIFLGRRGMTDLFWNKRLFRQHQIKTERPEP